MTTPILGIVCGMQAEARALGRWRGDPRVALAVSGGRAGRAEAEARRLAAAGVRTLLSWGIAGGLDPALAPGTLVHADAVLCPDGTVHALARRDGLPPRSKGMPFLLAGSDELLLDACVKARLRARTGAVAVDMESHRIAAVAAAAGLPCHALRAVSDPAGRSLPHLAVTALVAAARDSRSALSALAAAADATIAPLLGRTG